MKKILSVVSLFLAMMAPQGMALAAAGDISPLEAAEDCVPGPQVGAKIGNWLAEDVKSTSNYKPCDRFLLPNDPLAKTMLYYVSDKDTVLEVKEQMEELGGNFEEITRGFRGKNSFLVLFNTLMFVAFLAAALYSGARVSKVFRESNVTENAARGSVMLAALLLGYHLLSNLPLYIARGVLYFTSSYNFMIYNFHDFDSLEKVTATEGRLEQFADTFNSQNYEVANALMLNETVNVVTDNVILKKNVGSTVSVEGQWFSDGDSVSRPTFSEYLKYHDHCFQRRFADVYNDYEVNLGVTLGMLWDGDSLVTKIPETAILTSGGDTGVYDCPESEGFGKETGVVTIKQNTNLVLQNFLSDKFGVDYSNNTSVTDQIADTFSSTRAIINNGLENIVNAATSNPQGIESEIETALAAVKEARTSGTNVRNTSSFKSLVDKVKKETAQAFAYQNPGNDSLKMSDLMLIDAVKAVVYKYSKLFGPTDVDSDLEVEITGYHYLKDFLEETSRKALVYDCTVRKGNLYDKHIIAAERFNNGDKSILNRDAELPNVSDVGCYEFNPETQTMTAVANPANADILKEEIEDRVFAVKTLLDAYDAGVISNLLIEEDSEELVALRLEFLNKLRINMFSATRSSYIFMDQENEIRQSLSAVKHTISVSDNLNINTGQITNYHNNLRFASKGYNTISDSLSDVMNDTENSQYDFGYMFKAVGSHSGGAQQTSSVELDKILDDSWEWTALLGLDDLGDLFFKTGAECPIKSPEGDCEASLQQINYESLNHMVAHATAATGAVIGFNFVAGVCKGGAGEDGGMTAGKLALLGGPVAKALQVIGCGAISIIDFAMPLAYLYLIVAWLLVALAFLASYLPLAIDALLFVMVLVYVIVPIIMLPVVFSIEAVKAAVIYTLFKEERTQQSFMNTVKILKGLIFRPFILLSILSVYLFFQMSPSLGGSIFDLLSQVDLPIIGSLLIMATISWLTMKGAKVALDIESEMHNLLGISSKPFFEETGQLDGMVKTAMLYGSQRVVGGQVKAASQGAKKIGQGIPQAMAKKKEESARNRAMEAEDAEINTKNSMMSAGKGGKAEPDDVE